MGIEAALIGGGLGLLGSSMQTDAAQSAAAANVEAARIAAEAQKFRPVGVTTRFGTSNFQTDANGNVIGAGYNVAPDIAAMRDRLFSQAGGQGFQTAEQSQMAQQGLFNLGNQYLAQSPQEAAQQWMQSQQALLAPSREQAWANLNQGNYNQGTTGLKVAQGGNLQAANPYASALANTQAMQDLNLASQAQQQGMNQAKFGAGLFGTGLDIGTAGYNPLKTQFGLGQTMEQAGQGAMDLGRALGGQVTTGATNAANTIYNAQTAANNMNAVSPFGAALTGAAGNQQLMSGLGNWFSGPSVGATSNNLGYGPSNNPNMYALDSSFNQFLQK
jgi:hypothetical protein